VSGIDENAVDSVINYSTIYNLQESYTASALNTDSNYNDSAFDANIEEYNENLVASVTENLKTSNYKIDEDVKNNIENFSQKITDYTKGQITFEYMDKLQTFANLGETISLVAIIAFFIFSVILALIILSMGTKKYRTLRTINYSFYASGLFNLVLVAGMEIVKAKKSLVIYPIYLCDSVMKYINNCIMAIGLSGVVLLVVSLVITTFVWQLKHADK
jgi:membrane-associated HD superfamily phosphohydrolase